MGRRRYILFSLAFCLSCRESSDLSSRTILTGAWTSACLPGDASNDPSQIRYAFGDDHTVVRQQIFYLENTCLGPKGEISHRGVYSLEVRKEVALYNIDMFFSDVRAAPLSEAGVIDWTLRSFCDANDWKLNSAKNVLGLSASECLSFKTKRIEYRDLVELTRDQRLSFASTLSHQSPRPPVMPVFSPLGEFSRDPP